MSPDFLSSILLDGLMAAIAATGFAVISYPPKRASAVSALRAAIGHAFRFTCCIPGTLAFPADTL